MPSSPLVAPSVPQKEPLTTVIVLDDEGDVVDTHHRNWPLGFVLTPDDDTAAGCVCSGYGKGVRTAGIWIKVNTCRMFPSSLSWEALQALCLFQ